MPGFLTRLSSLLEGKKCLKSKAEEWCVHSGYTENFCWMNFKGLILPSLEYIHCHRWATKINITHNFKPYSGQQFQYAFC